MDFPTSDYVFLMRQATLYRGTDIIITENPKLVNVLFTLFLFFKIGLYLLTKHVILSN